MLRLTPKVVGVRQTRRIMNEVSNLVGFAASCLEPLLERNGTILYSSAETLRPSPVYFLGLNPGGDPTELPEHTLRQAVAELPTKTTNDYLDKSWAGSAPGKSTLQIRVCWLFEKIGFQPRQVCSSNLIFVRSVSAAHLSFRNLAEQCWPVHNEILKIVRPRLILTFGNSSSSPYTFIRERLGASPEECFPSGHGTWQCRAFVTRSGVRVVGLPHLSRYAIHQHPEVVTWLHQFIAA